MLTRNNNKTSDWLLSILKLAQIKPDESTQTPILKNDQIKQQLKKEFLGKDEQIDYLLSHPDVTDINVARWLMKNVMSKAMKGYDPVPLAMNAINKFNEIKNSFPPNSNFSKDLSSYSYEEPENGKIPLINVIKETIGHGTYNASPNKRKQYLPVAAQNIVMNVIPFIKIKVPQNEQQTQINELWRFINDVYLIMLKNHGGFYGTGNQGMDMIMDFQKNNHPGTWHENHGTDNYLIGYLNKFRKSKSIPEEENPSVFSIRSSMIVADQTLEEDKADYVTEIKRFLNWKFTPVNDEDEQEFKNDTELSIFDNKQDLNKFNDNHMSDEERTSLYILNQNDLAKDQNSGEEFEKLNANGLTAIRITQWTEFMSNNLCKNANWCIKRKKQFEDYQISESNPVFLILEGQMQLAMVGFESKQIKDVNDNIASEDLVVKIYPILKLIANRYYNGKLPNTQDFEALLGSEEYIDDVKSNLYSKPISDINDLYSDLTVIKKFEKSLIYEQSTFISDDIYSKRFNDIKSIISNSPPSEVGAELTGRMINKGLMSKEKDGIQYIQKIYSQSDKIEDVLTTSLILIIDGKITKKQAGNHFIETFGGVDNVKIKISSIMENDGYQEPNNILHHKDRLKTWLNHNMSSFLLQNLQTIVDLGKDRNEIRNNINKSRNELGDYFSDLILNSSTQQPQAVASWINSNCRFAKS